ncbi:MAG: four helix bundle protein [Lewinellaceae bacterium]|nr:four helix bundle protein [Saprospiraceae bacterium]MCB9339463.1 four helix bundle protein [Lewinellaceae bacterium]
MEKTYTHKKTDPLREKSFKLAIRIVKLYKYLTEGKKEYVLSKQLLRSGTNPGAMVREAANAESGMDFIHKLGIAQKEVGETHYWLELLFATNYLSDIEFQSFSNDTEEVLKLLTSSIKTKKKNLGLKVLSIAVVLLISLKFLLY